MNTTWLVELAGRLSSATTVENFAKEMDRIRLLRQCLQKCLTGPVPNPQLLNSESFCTLAKAVKEGLDLLQRFPRATPASVKSIGMLCCNLSHLTRGWLQGTVGQQVELVKLQMAQLVMKTGKSRLVR